MASAALTDITTHCVVFLWRTGSLILMSGMEMHDMILSLVEHAHKSEAQLHIPKTWCEVFEKQIGLFLIM